MAETFGRGAMTNHWVDMKNTDVAMIIGSNAAENHPMSFKWLQEGRKNRGTKIISVDPRFTRTSAQSDVYAPMRSGTDIAFINGIINFALTRGHINLEYVRHYTNAAFLVNDGFDFDEVTGRFSGFDAGSKTYSDKSTWGYQTDANVGNATDGNIGNFWFGRSGTDGVTTAVAADTFVSATANFSDGIVGRDLTVDGTAYAIATVVNATTVTLTGYTAADAIDLPWSLEGEPTYFTVEDSNTFNHSLVGRKLSLTSGINAGTWTIQEYINSRTVVLLQTAATETDPAVSVTATADDLAVSWVLPGVPIKDTTLTNPNCVYQIMKQHYARYTPEVVADITGCPEDTFLEVAQIYTNTGLENKTGTILYAMGTTQHSCGTQNVRTYAILQLLMGNVGLAGGGINALRGESNVQGSTDMALLFHILPGYLKTPRASNTTLGIDTTAGNGIVYGQDQYNPGFLALSAEDQAEAKASFLWKWTPQSNDPESANWWQYSPKYMVSLLKAFYGEAATEANEFAYHNLGKIDDSTNYSHMSVFDQMDAGVIKGLFCFGQNPAVGGPSAEFERRAIDKLDWLVSVDIWETDTSVFWKRPDIDPATINTEVWQLPAAASYEKEGSVVNSGRWAQWRYKAVDAPGEAKDDAWIVTKLVKALQASPPTNNPGAITDLTWPYLTADDHIDVDLVAREINGRNLADDTQLVSFGALKFDGTTDSGNWLYCGQYTEDAGNKLKNRDNTNTQDVSGIGLYSEWSWCWPINRRIIYNRASLRPDTQEPWDPTRAVIRVDQDPTSDKYKKPIVGDIPDGGWQTDPTRPGYKHPFIMKPEGHSRLFGMGRADGPLTEHYEPVESPLTSSTVNQAPYTPAVHIYGGEQGEMSNRDQYPIVATTYRVTEHWQAGCMTRNIPFLGEMMPYMFVEMSKEFAEENNIVSGDECIIDNIRGSIKAYAIVTDRFRPFKLKEGGNEKTVHQIGLPWHWGYSGLFTGDSANCLTPHVGDCNTRIPEYKAFLCNVKKA